jgi:hypothetical protein
MGIKRGYSTVDEFYKSESINLKDLTDETIVIDTQGLLHRMIRENISNKYEFYLQMINFIEKFKRFNIKLIFVFDGKTNLVKSEKTINMRKKAQVNLNKLLEENDEQNDSENNKEKSDKLTILKKKACNIPIWIINECKKLFDSLDCIYIHVDNYEGDQIIAQIIKSNLIKYVYSEDFDMLLFDIPYVLKSLDYINNTFKLYNKIKLLESLNISSSQLIDVAFLTGTDFNCGLYKSTFNSNLEIIKEYVTIENFKSNLIKINSKRKEGCMIILPSYNFDYKLVKNYFTLENIDDKTNISINSKLDTYFDIKYKYNKNDLIKINDILKCFEKLKTISVSSYINYKYSLKLTNYCKEHFGISC